jgi:hypothetical protein
MGCFHSERPSYAPVEMGSDVPVIGKNPAQMAPAKRNDNMGGVCLPGVSEVGRRSGLAQAGFLQQSQTLGLVIIAARIPFHRVVFIAACNQIGAAQIFHPVFQVGIGIEKV